MKKEPAKKRSYTRNGSRWDMIRRVIVLKRDVIGNGGEIFKAGSRLRVSSEPLGRLAGDKFNAAAIGGPEFLKNGPWRGVSQLGFEDFDVVGMPAVE